MQRLNDLYKNALTSNNSIQKCIKHLCETVPYRMLKDWSYELEADLLPDETQLPPPDTENDLNDLDYITGDVIRNISQEITKNVARRDRNEVYIYIYYFIQRKLIIDCPL